MEKLAAGLGQSGSIKNVMGEPIQVHHKTVIPVARVAYGFGGGFGNGRKTHPGQSTGAGDGTQSAVEQGAGGGGGVHVNLKGVYEITPVSTRFIPANPLRYVFIGMVAGFLLQAFLFPKKKR